MTPAFDSVVSHGDIFRHSIPIRAGAYWVLFSGCALFAMCGVYPFPLATIAAITAGQSLVLVVLRTRGASSRSWAAAYLAFEAGCQTAIFHVSGDLRIAFAPIVYTFELLNPGIRFSRTGHFLVANAFAALFGGMVLAEATELLPMRTTPALVLTPAVRTSTIAIVFLCLNVAALFISTARDLLESRSRALDVAQRSLLQHSAALEARVEQRTAELEASYRTLENATTELRTLIYGITHDLKTPFNSILLTIDLLLRRRGALLDEAIASELHAVAATARRGEAMLQDLLNAFRITSVHEDRRRIDLNALVAQAATVLQPQIIQRDVAVVSGRLPAVWGEARKMAHVIDNLLSNAVRHAPCATGLVEVTGTVDGGHVFLRVRDNGPGIPSEYHQRIFELFGRAPAADAASDVTSGTGVGLAVVKRIAEDHNGDVWVESSPGNGATFVVRLPAPSDDVPMT